MKLDFYDASLHQEFRVFFRGLKKEIYFNGDRAIDFHNVESIS